jgi:hypothetical protein
VVGGEKIKSCSPPSSWTPKFSLYSHWRSMEPPRVSEKRQWLPCQLWGLAAGQVCGFSFKNCLQNSWSLAAPSSSWSWVSGARGWGVRRERRGEAATLGLSFKLTTQKSWFSAVSLPGKCCWGLFHF